jgi:Na+-driven multidrug efflux pump
MYRSFYGRQGMNTSRLTPKVIIWWGIIVDIVGVLLVLFVPDLIAGVVNNQAVNGGSLGAIIETVLRAAAIVAPPLGAAFIGAGIVMAYIRRHSAAEDVEAED